MKILPQILVISRIPIATLICTLGLLNIENNGYNISFLMIIGLLIDIFDGILARKIGVSNSKFRVLDSNVDQFFWSVTLFTVVFRNKDYMLGNLAPIVFVLILEISTYVISYMKFKKTIATHSLLAKLWAISLLIFLIELTISSSGYYSFWACIIIGVISRIEIISIVLSLKKWTTDIPSIFSVNKLNKGIPIKRYKLFNG